MSKGFSSAAVQHTSHLHTHLQSDEWTLSLELQGCPDGAVVEGGETNVNIASF